MIQYYVSYYRYLRLIYIVILKKYLEPYFILQANATVTPNFYVSGVTIGWFFIEYLLILSIKTFFSNKNKINTLNYNNFTGILNHIQVFLAIKNRNQQKQKQCDQWNSSIHQLFLSRCLLHCHLSEIRAKGKRGTEIHNVFPCCFTKW